MSPKIKYWLLGCALGLGCAARQQPEHIQFVLGDAGAGGVVVAPKRARVEADPDRVTVNAGRHFELVLARGHVDLQEVQAAVIDAHQLSLEEFEVHTDDTLVWRYGPSATRRWYGFVYVGSLAGEPFSCRSGAGRFTRADIEVMLDACRDVREPAQVLRTRRTKKL